jgi:cation transport ATPase
MPLLLPRAETAHRWGRALWLTIAVALVLYAVVFVLWVFFGGTLELGITEDEVDVTRSEIEAFSPSLMDYIDHLHVAIGGFIAGLGVAIGGMAWHGLREHRMWALWVMVAAVGVALLISTPLHHVHGFDTLAHMGMVYPGVAIGALATWWTYHGMKAKDQARRE